MSTVISSTKFTDTNKPDMIRAVFLFARACSDYVYMRSFLMLTTKKLYVFLINDFQTKNRESIKRKSKCLITIVYRDDTFSLA